MRTKANNGWVGVPVGRGWRAVPEKKKNKANNGDSCNLIIPYYAPGTVDWFTNINPFSLTIKLKEGICVGKYIYIYIYR